jgi:hypothetical protein
MNAFETYAKAAATRVNQPPKLIGPAKTRAAATAQYTEIVANLHACEDADMLDAYLASARSEITQIHAELDFLWNGDGADFTGLRAEIASARERVVANQIRNFGPG